MYDIIELSGKLVPELKEIAKELKIKKYEKLLKQDLIYKILDQQALNPSQDILKQEKSEINTNRRGRPSKEKGANVRDENKPAKEETPVTVNQPAERQNRDENRHRGRRQKYEKPDSTVSVGENKDKAESSKPKEHIAARPGPGTAITPG